MKGRKILLVEDVDAMREYLAQLLRERGAEVRSASSVLAARLELERHRPEVMLLDLVLPGESAQDLRKEALEQGIPVVLMTGEGLPPHAQGVSPLWKKFDVEESRGGVAASLLELQRILDAARSPC